jgi:O-antigen/teichoic acid export membrane protein
MKESFPYAALIFLMSMYTRVDTIMMKQMLGAEGDVQNGIYAHSYRLLDVGNMFGLMFASMLLPMFGRMLLQKTNIQPIIQLCVNLLLPFSVMSAVGAAFYGYPLIHALFAHATPYDGTIFSLLMASFPAFCMMYVYSTLLTANGNLRILVKIAIVGVILNVALNYILIPKYMAVGAAISTVVTQTTLAIGYIIFSGKTFRLPFNLKWIAAHAAFVLVSVGLAYSINMLSVTWYYKIAVFGIMELLFMFPFGFVSVKAIKQLANK